MAAERDWIRIGFWVAGLFNLVGMAWVSRLLTAPLGEVDPVFGTAGVVAVCVWGLAYIAGSYGWRSRPWIPALFAVEKAVYVAHWGWWLANHTDRVAELMQRDPQMGLFFSAYGLGDGLFCAFFLLAFRQARRGAP